MLQTSFTTHPACCPWGAGLMISPSDVDNFIKNFLYAITFNIKIS